MRVGPSARPTRQLKQARGTKASDRISRRHWFPLENPAGHRETQRRVTDINKSHIHPPDGITPIPSHRGSRTTDAKLALFPRKVNEPKVPCYCTEVMGGLRLRHPAKRTAFLGLIVQKNGKDQLNSAVDGQSTGA